MRRVAMLAAVLSIASFAHGAIEPAVCRVEETRSVTLVKDNVGRTPDSLKVVLSLKGPEANASTKYGNLKLQEAVDDKGNSLMPKKDTFHDPAEFVEFSNSFFRKTDLERNRPAADAQIEIELAPANRASTSIARLRGTFELARQGTNKTVELTNLVGAGRKKLAIPAEAGIEITVTVKPGSNVRSLGIEIKGDESAVESLEVLDGQGEKVSSGMSSWSFNGKPKQKAIQLQRPLDASMKLVAKIAVDQTKTTVPFDLKDVALP